MNLRRNFDWLNNFVTGDENWWGVKGVKYWELLSEKITLNAHRCRAQLNKLDTVLINNGLFSGKIYFQHDNAKPLVAKLLQKKTEKFGWELLPHPPYSPDLALSDHHLFRSLNNDMRNRTCKDDDDLKS